jgi:long-chain acyl-CoA synthetase
VTGFFGALNAGAVVVPLDAGLPEAEQSRLIEHAGAGRLLHAGEMSVAARELAAATGVEPFCIERHGFTVEPAAGQRRPVHREAGDPAVICYTSGTTGRPKGVTISHGALQAQIRALRSVMGNDHRTRVVSLLPPSHLFELTAGTLAVLAGGGSVIRGAAPTPESVVAAMAAARPRTMVVVPLFLGALRAAIGREVTRLGPVRGVVMKGLLALAGRVGSRRLRRWLCRPLLRRFGGRLEYFVSGGAPLDPEVAEFFDALGVPVLQGYGLTEASPVVATNRPGDNRPGSVGRPLPGTEVRIADDGEIRVRGPQLMLGYWRDPAATRAAVDSEGWLRTGDVGRLDDDGYLYVEGRSGHRIVLACGEKVQPEEVETVILRSGLVAECGVIGRPSRLPLHRGSDEVCAVVVPAAGVATDDRCAERLRLEVSRCCAELAAYKRPTRVIVRDEALPTTATRKLRRAELAAWLDARPEVSS